MIGRRGVVVVGASAGGLSTVEALRRQGHAGPVTVVGAEKHPPYDRPPLSKQVLSGAWEPDRARLRPDSALAESGAEFVYGDPAVGLDADALTVHTASGRRLHAEAVVVATGLRPRTLPGQAELAGAHVLRSLEDALALREELGHGARVAVVGDGVLGTEIAATARGTGAEVTLVGPQSAPMTAQLGPRAAALLADLHTERGIRLRLGTGVSGLCGSGGRVTGVRLADGEVLPADTVVVAIGADPATAWLQGSGLATDDGLVCDSRCRAAEGVYAVGDVARWHHEDLGSIRLENRTNATEQAAAAAAGILGGGAAYRPVPYFWTDQFDVKVQIYGRPTADADFDVVEGEIGGGRFVAEYRRGGAVTAVLGWRMPKQARLRAAAALNNRAPVAP
ncbi:pyridine nucleotide-disulfide oxidoreductase [Streptomonospora alba]|uniref:Pyridine nucleotide-disulfide oxidoreductase n=1 Tax=Streptomonospora alba TaxID=183763 RepID=A0A0C2FLP0_9ACTN|nr:FAD-dependent oxidoreductase [Streptomonospora alba]KII00195.1 pyridine nucleotide-disulfide oxidoreductase [Streptomonospora alba]